MTAVTERGDGASCILMTQGDAIICAQSAVEVNARWIAAMRVIYCQHEGERMKAFALSQGA